MTKSELKTGMVAENRAGLKYLVLLDTVIGGVSVIKRYDTSGGWDDLANFSEDLTYANRYGLAPTNETSVNDIVKVYAHEYVHKIFSTEGLKLIWERDKETPAQKQIKVLEKKIAESQAELETLKKTLQEGK